jgi:hypothetical protein
VGTLEQPGRRVKSNCVEFLRNPKIFLEVLDYSSPKGLTQPLRGSIVLGVIYIEIVDKVEKVGMVDKMKSGGIG